MVADARKEYVVSCALGALGALGSLASRRWEKPTHELELQLHGAAELQAFLETAAAVALQAERQTFTDADHSEWPRRPRSHAAFIG